MEPTFCLGEVALYSSLGTSPIRHEDVVVVSHPSFYKGDCVPLRVAALGGDLVSIADGQLHLNGKSKPEPYLLGAAAESDYSRNFDPITVPEAHAFLLGDCRDNSNDSRLLGPVPLAAIVGKVQAAHTLADPSSQRLVR
jgi:signal peptidase I